MLRVQLSAGVPYQVDAALDIPFPQYRPDHDLRAVVNAEAGSGAFNNVPENPGKLVRIVLFVHTAYQPSSFIFLVSYTGIL